MAELELSRGKVAIIDDEDLERLSEWKWSYHALGYAYRMIGPGKARKAIYLHRFLAGVSGKDVDHINGNGLDNRKINLRTATRAENLRNAGKRNMKTSSRFKGVCWDKKNKKWISSITKARRNIYLGYFLSEEDAARAYNDAAFSLFGEFAKPNEL